MARAEAWNTDSEAGPSYDALSASYYGHVNRTGYYPVAGMDISYCSGSAAFGYGRSDAVMRCPISPPAGPGLRKGSRHALPSRRSAGVFDGGVDDVPTLSGTAS